MKGSNTVKVGGRVVLKFDAAVPVSEGLSCARSSAGATFKSVLNTCVWLASLISTHFLVDFHTPL